MSFPPSPIAPQAPRRPHTTSTHGDERVDEWYWLGDRNNPEVVAHLEAENEYTAMVMRDTRQLQQELFEEFLSHIEETDETVPAKRDDYWYYRRTVEGLQYPIHCRKFRSLNADEQVMLDEN